jgi:hypothetical protein
MKKLTLSLGVIFWGATNFSQVSLAQYHVPMQPPVPRHDTMFPRRDRSSPSNNGSTQNSQSGSRLTRNQIRDTAYDPEFRARMQRNLCGTNTRPKVNGYRYTAYEAAILREELGCP